MLKYKGGKKDMHSATERFIQMQPGPNSQEASIRSEILLWHMLLAQDCTEEVELMPERRTALTVLRVQS